MTDTARLAVNTIKTLAMDAVQKANSGHPGLPMGMADAAYVLWTRFLKFDPEAPAWPDRDRFVLSAGHGSMLLYALLHLSGYDLPLVEIERFRQLGSKTPGHPEYGLTPGVETTTGPLGQGFATAVGMAMAEARLRALFGAELCDHRTFAIVSDGDLMEGVASEAASLAGHLALSHVNYLYDSNRISIEGSTDLAFTEDVNARFRAYGWHTWEVDGHDHEAVAGALAEAVADEEAPALVLCHTHIAHGSPGRQDSAKAHGAPLGGDEVAATKAALGWEHPAFYVPEEARTPFVEAGARGREKRHAWEARLAGATADVRGRWDAMRTLPDGWDGSLPEWPPGDKTSTRKASGKCIQALAATVPALWGGSADLAESTLTLVEGEKSFSASDRTGRNLHFGVREHAMAAAGNGISLHGGFRPYVATFLIFSDYCRPAIRLAALMRQPVVYVFTHDSVFLGEDGPTHQPVEHLAALRAMPNLRVVRPADGNETAAAWRFALARTDGPTLLALTRQDLPVLPGSAGVDVAAGGYVVSPAPRDDYVLLATGSEVHVAVGAQAMLREDGLEGRVVSLPCVEEFLARPDRDTVVPPGVAARVSVEAASPLGWERLHGERGEHHGIDHFGESAPLAALLPHFGFTPEAVAARVRAVVARL